MQVGTAILSVMWHGCLTSIIMGTTVCTTSVLNGAMMRPTLQEALWSHSPWMTTKFPHYQCSLNSAGDFANLYHCATLCLTLPSALTTKLSAGTHSSTWNRMKPTQRSSTVRPAKAVLEFALLLCCCHSASPTPGLLHWPSLRYHAPQTGLVSPLRVSDGGCSILTPPGPLAHLPPVPL